MNVLRKSKNKKNTTLSESIYACLYMYCKKMYIAVINRFLCPKAKLMFSWAQLFSKYSYSSVYATFSKYSYSSVYATDVTDVNDVNDHFDSKV